MSTTLLIVLLLLGVVLLTLEIVALPGGVAGFFGAIMIGIGVWQTFAKFGTATGTVVLLCAMALITLMLVLFMKRKTWRRFSLDEEVRGTVNGVDGSIKVGTRGVTISRLAPTGKALVDGKPVEVHAVNKFIDPDRQVEVVAVEGYRIDVVETSDDRFANKE